MLTKVLALAKSKVALAVLGVLAVGSGGGAVAVAASQGHFDALGIQLGSAKGDGPDGAKTPEGQDGSHAEGTLTTCDATAGTISVTTEGGAVYAFVVTSATRFNGETQSGDHSGSTSDQPSATDATPAADSTDGSTGSSSAPASTFGLSDLCNLTGPVKVQVQATASTSGSTTTYTATKVTVEGQDAQDNGTPEATEAPETQQDFSGSVASVSATGFTMTADGVQYTVDTSNARFDGGSLATLKVGAQVQVQGTLSGGTITATGVEMRGTGSGSSSVGSGSESGH